MLAAFILERSPQDSFSRAGLQGLQSSPSLKVKASEGFSGGKSKRAGCFAVAEKCSPGTQSCVIPRGAPRCSWPHPPTAGAAASPETRESPCSLSSGRTQLSCDAAVPILCGMRLGQGWGGRLWHETRSGEGREPTPQLTLPFPPAACCRKLSAKRLWCLTKIIKFLLFPLPLGVESV